MKLVKMKPEKPRRRVIQLKTERGSWNLGDQDPVLASEHEHWEVSLIRRGKTSWEWYVEAVSEQTGEKIVHRVISVEAVETLK